MGKTPTHKELQQKIADLEEQIFRQRQLDGTLSERQATERALLNAQTQSAILVDLQGTILAINGIAAKRLDRDPEQLIGLTIDEYLPQDSVASRRSFDERVVKTKKSVRFQDERGGRVFDNNICPVFGETGGVVAIAVYAEDITDRANAERKLRESESRLKNLIENVQVGIVVHAADTAIIHCNSTAQRILGISADQMLGKTADDPTWRFLREDGSEMSEDEFPVNTVLATRKPLKELLAGVCRADADGRVWVLVNAVPEFDENGTLTQVIVTLNDVTERKNAEEALRNSERKFHTLADTSPLAISIMRDDHYLYVNDAWQRISGYSKEEA